MMFYLIYLGVASFAFYDINYRSYQNDEFECLSDPLIKCEKLTTLNRILTSFLCVGIVKNTCMSTILFVSLYKFYAGLKKIGLDFKLEKCNLALHIGAFGIPIIAGLVYIICIIEFNQVALFTSTRATKVSWQVLGPSIVYEVSMGTVQILQLVLITNYSIKAAGRKEAEKKEQ